MTTALDEGIIIFLFKNSYDSFNRAMCTSLIKTGNYRDREG